MARKIIIMLMMTPGIIYGWLRMNLYLLFGMKFGILHKANKSYCETMDEIYSTIVESGVFGLDTESIIEKHSKKFHDSIK